MGSTLLLVVGAWGILTLVGWSLLAPLAAERRDALLPAAPVLGLALLVVVLHDTTLLVPASVGLVGVAAVVAALLVVAFRRDRGWWRTTPQSLALLIVGAAVGALPAVWVLGPAVAVGDTGPVQPTSNNDAFYYIAVADWLQDHPATDVPAFTETPAGGGDSPSYLAAWGQLTLDLRIGQELTHAALSTVLRTDVIHTWYPLTALWVLLLPAAGLAAARFLRLRTVTGLALGAAISVSTLVVFQFGSQNSDSLDGTPLLLVALGAVVRAVGRDPLVPAPLAGVLLAALVGTYTEYLPLVALGLVVAVVARRPRELLGSVRSALVLLAAGVLCAPLVWVRAVRSLLFLGGIQADNYPSAFADVPLPLALERFLGIVGPGGPEARTWLLVLVGCWVVLGLLGATLSRRRWFYLALVVPGAALSVYFVTVRDRPYTQQRVVQLLLPLALLVVAAGWDHLQRHLARRGHDRGRRRAGPRRGPVVVAALGLVGAIGFVAVNGASNNSLDLVEVARERHVGPEFAEAAGWLRELDGPDGDDSLVLVGDFFSQLWITDALRGSRDVSYPTLYQSYQAQNSYWDGEPRRWLLTDRAATMATDPGLVVRSNDRFALLDLSRGRAAVVVPADVEGQRSVLVLRSPEGPETVTLLGLGRPRAPTDVPPRPGFGRVVSPAELEPGTDRLRVRLTDRTAERVVLANDDDVFDLALLALPPRRDR